MRFCEHPSFSLSSQGPGAIPVFFRYAFQHTRARSREGREVFLKRIKWQVRRGHAQAGP